MLSYLDTIARVTSLRDGLRETLNSESGDRQATVELTEMTLTKLLGELVTPDPQICQTCLDTTGTETPAAGVTTNGAGVCEGHVLGTLLDGTGVRMTLVNADKFAERMSRLGLVAFTN